jgi:hypothetical protein
MPFEKLLFRISPGGRFVSKPFQTLAMFRSIHRQERFKSIMNCTISQTTPAAKIATDAKNITVKTPLYSRLVLLPDVTSAPKQLPATSTIDDAMVMKIAAYLRLRADQSVFVGWTGPPPIAQPPQRSFRHAITNRV